MTREPVCRLADLLPETAGSPDGAVAVAGVTSDSREVRPGFLFAALPGVKADGARFVPQAIAAGAGVIVAAEGAELPADLGGAVVVRIRNPRKLLALMAARFFGAQPETALAVTGTSGKTSVVSFTQQILVAAGLKAASLGTIGLVTPDGATYGSLTTPDPVSLSRTLAGLAGQGVTHIAFEASSHGLDQHRLDGVRLTAAAFTNLGRDHLDYHPTIEAYFQAKMRLFEELLAPGQTAVINADGAYAAEAVAVARRRGLSVMTVGRGGEALRLVAVARDGFRQVLTLEADGQRREVMLPLIGAYQVENALVAAGLAMAAGVDLDAALTGLSGLRGVKGRLDVVGEVNGGLAVVDYAHKPEALAAALDAVRPFATGRLIAVFGCGGDRDRGKRPIMGRIAVERSDVVIVTDDNPRTEEPAAIRAAILADAPGAIEIGDRRAAIRRGVDMLGLGDVLIVAGKGHETGQIIGDVVLPFSDHEEIAAALAAAGGTTGGASGERPE